MMSNEIEEVVHSLQQLRAEFEDLAVGGLRSIGPEHLPLLKGLQQELERIGAWHLSTRLRTLSEAIAENDKSAATALMQAQASLRLFERLLTIEAIENHYTSLLAEDESL